MSPPELTPNVEGPNDGETLFFVHGWPDDSRIWDGIVDSVRDRYRCVRVELPSYSGAEYRRWGVSQDAMVEAMADCIRRVSPGKPVTLIVHDWGAHWGYWLHHHHPELVERIVGLDISPDVKPNLYEVSVIIGYQWWLVAAFVIGGPLGDWMTRFMAGLLGAPRPREQIFARMNYPYLYAWRDIVTGRAGRLFRDYFPELPILYVYGARKPGQFHTRAWLERVRALPHGAVVALPNANHWVTEDPTLAATVREWLDRSSRSSKR